MGKIQDDNKLYSFLRYYVDYHIKRGFRKYQVVGKENLLGKGAKVYGSNHCNALTDALVLLAKDHKKKVFIARADIFKNPTIAKILRWLRILPIYRIRDGISSVRDNNNDIIDQAVDVIHDEVQLYLFPEATHRTKHSLRKLSKGIFHIALEANKRFGDQKQVFIVPTGIDYGDYFRYRSNVLLSFGEPINVTEFVKRNETENEAVIMNNLRDVLSERMSKLITFLPDDEDYDAIWEIVKIKAHRLPSSLAKRRDNNNKVVENVVKFRDKEPEKAKKIFEKILDFTAKRKASNISVYSVSRKLPLFSMLLKTFILLLGLPIFVAAAVASSPIWIVAYFILNRLGDAAFRNTVNFGVELVVHTVMMLVAIPVLFCVVPWELAMISLLFFEFSYPFFFDYCEYLRRWCSDIRWTFNNKLRRQFEEIDINF